ncbi:MAG: response regulator [Planctomycetota bacterium]|nr:response regulator [Planctomycetota bacterium]
MSEQHVMSPGEVTLLVVEDEPRMKEVLLRAASSWGFVVAPARTAEEAIRMMQAAASDIVLLDLNLPGMSGIECLQAIRHNWPKTQVVILTGFGDLDAAKQAIHLDVVEFLTKPSHLGELEVALDRARRRLDLHALPQHHEQEKIVVPAVEPDAPATLDELERQAILAALERNAGNRTATAPELGISLRTLYYRLSEYQKHGYRVD